MALFLLGPTVTSAQVVDSTTGRTVLRCEKRTSKAYEVAVDRFGRCLMRPESEAACFERVEAKVTAILRTACPEDLVRGHFTTSSFDRYAAELIESAGQRAREIYEDRIRSGTTARTSEGVSQRALAADFRFTRQTTATKNQCDLADRRVELIGAGGACRRDRVQTLLGSRTARYERTVAKLGEPSLASQLSRSLPMLIADPSCEQQIALDVYLNLVQPLVQERLNLIWAEQQRGVERYDAARAAVEVGKGFARFWDLKHIASWSDFKLQTEAAIATGDFFEVAFGQPEDPIAHGFDVFAEGTAACVETWVTKKPKDCLVFFGTTAIDTALTFAQALVARDSAQKGDVPRAVENLN